MLNDETTKSDLFIWLIMINYKHSLNVTRSSVGKPCRSTKIRLRYLQLRISFVNLHRN